MSEQFEDITESKLDTDNFDDITNVINNLEQQRDKLDSSEELLLNTGLNSDLITQVAEQLKTMPRNKLLQMINSLGLENQLPDHSFSTFDKSSVEKRLSKKINALKAKRSKVFKTQSTAPSTGTHTEKTELNSDTKQSENNIPSEPKKLTKNQKRRLRQKKAKESENTNDTDTV